MTTPFKRVEPGEAFKPLAIDYNAHQAAAEAHAFGEHGGEVTATETTPDSHMAVRVKNSTGTDLDQFSVMAIDGSVWEPGDTDEEKQKYKAAIYLEGKEPEAKTQYGKLAIALAPSKSADGFPPLCVFKGLTQVKLLVHDAKHEFAKMIDGDCTKLESCVRGPARIWGNSNEPTTDGNGDNVPAEGLSIVEVNAPVTYQFRGAVDGAITYPEGSAKVIPEGMTQPVEDVLWTEQGETDEEIGDGSIVTCELVERDSGPVWVIHTWQCQEEE